MKKNTESDTKIINLSYLIELSKGNKVFVKDMINLFLEENPEEIQLLEKGIAEYNYDLIRITAHKLRSTIPFVGLDKVVGNEVNEIETLAADCSDINEIEKHFKKLKSTCAEACSELTAFNLA